MFTYIYFFLSTPLTVIDVGYIYKFSIVVYSDPEFGNIWNFANVQCFPPDFSSSFGHFVLMFMYLGNFHNVSMANNTLISGKAI